VTAVDRTLHGLNHGRDKKVLSSLKCPDWLWGPPSLLFSGYCGSFSGVK